MTKGVVLIVDDERSIRITLKSTLEPEGYAVVLASSGEEALQIVESESVSLVLLDLRLPGMNGLEVLAVIAREHPDVPVLVISAHGNVDTAVQAIKGGARGFIEKPFTPDRIRKAVAHAVDAELRAKETTETYELHMEEAIRTLRGHDLDPALEHAKMALSIDPTRPEAFNVIGVVQQLRGRRPQAQRYFMAALALDPGYRPAQMNRDNIARPPAERKKGGYQIE